MHTVKDGWQNFRQKKGVSFMLGLGLGFAVVRGVSLKSHQCSVSLVNKSLPYYQQTERESSTLLASSVPGHPHLSLAEVSALGGHHVQPGTSSGTQPLGGNKRGMFWSDSNLPPRAANRTPCCSSYINQGVLRAGCQSPRQPQTGAGSTERKRCGGGWMGRERSCAEI